MMRLLGITVILMWASHAHTLYPLPPQLVSQYKNYIASETDLFAQTLSGKERAEYFRDKAAFIESRLVNKTIATWISWCLRSFLVMLGLLGGWLILNNRKFRLIVVPTSGIFLMIIGFELSRSLPAWEAPWLHAYVEFIARGNYSESILYELLFYNEYCILPVLHLALLLFCLARRGN